MTYLDTHAALWLALGQGQRLSEKAEEQIRREELLISPMVVLELQYLHEIQRLRVPGARVIEVLSRDLGLQVCDLPFPQVIEKACSLKWCRDPFDRVIVAQAEANAAPLVTKDLTIRQHYARAVW